jgi:HEAT repeat protein
MLLSVAGCVEPTLEERLASTDPKARVGAVFDLAGEAMPDAEATAHLIHLLADEDEGVRLFAAAALRRRTGQRYGFLPSVCPRHRAAAIHKWIDWHSGTYPQTTDRFADLKKVIAAYADACAEPGAAGEAKPSGRD